MAHDPRMKSDEGSGATPVSDHDNLTGTPPLRTHDWNPETIAFRKAVAEFCDASAARLRKENPNYDEIISCPEIHVTAKGHEELSKEDYIGLMILWAGLAFFAGFVLADEITRWLQ